MADGQMVSARIPFGYGRDVNTGKTINRDRGEVFSLVGGRNDEKLIGMRYILPFDPKTSKVYTCDNCGRKFIAAGFYEAHKRKKDCNADQGEPTRAETAELIGVDVDKLKIDAEPEQRATDLNGAV